MLLILWEIILRIGLEQIQNAPLYDSDNEDKQFTFTRGRESSLDSSTWSIWCRYRNLRLNIPVNDFFRVKIIPSVCD